MEMPTLQNKDMWEQLADKVLDNFRFKYPDEIDIEYICKRYGIRVYNNIDKSSFSIPYDGDRRGLIYLAKGMDWIDRRIRCGEEFCHLYAHHSPQLHETRIVINKIENQAKKMSAYLFMPYRFLKELNLKENRGYLVSEIAEEFMVTEEMAHYRLELLYNRRIDMMAKFRGKVGTITMFE
jgi:Zn-dependent peptidase ImmA (M78 family)